MELENQNVTVVNVNANRRIYRYSNPALLSVYHTRNVLETTTLCRTLRQQLEQKYSKLSADTMLQSKEPHLYKKIIEAACHH